MATTRGVSGKLIDGVSMAASINGAWLRAWPGGECSFQAHAASGTHVGTLTFQVTNEPRDESTYPPQTVEDADGNDISFSAASGSAFDVAAEIKTNFKFIRPVYTASSGTGTLTVIGSRVQQAV